MPPTESGNTLDRPTASTGPQTEPARRLRRGRQIADADRLRRAIGNCFERASYPTMTEEERRRTLTFVVVGAGPTGVGLCPRIAVLGTRRPWA
jgi:hypothetical protein